MTFILGSRGGAFWSAVGLASVAAFASLEGTGLKVFEDAFAESALPMDTAVALITIVGGSAIAFFFEDARRASEAAAVQAALEQASAEETAALARAEKLATVGLLAAGVGHEVNNPLTYIQSNIEHVLEELERLDGADPDLADALRDALDGSLRSAQITGDLVTYARAEKPGPTSVVRLDEAARTALDLTRHQIPPEHAVAADLPVVPAVLATEGKVVQVLVNLLLNAAHAIEGRPDGSVVLRTGHEAQQSWVEVGDNGPGVPAALRKKIFDPFFTTKEVGKGTGLGLSVSRSIMRSLGGDLVLRPGAGGGATFRLQLPATLAQAAVASDAAPPPRGDALYRILIVDDEAGLAAPMARMLRPHEVVWCDSGAQLLQTLDQDPDFDLVLVDVMMHPMRGWEVLDAVRARRPALLQRCALMTGGMFTTVAKERLRTAEVPLMDKPLSRAEVIELIQDSRGPAGGAGVPRA